MAAGKPSGATSLNLAFAGLALLLAAWTYVEGGDLDPSARDQAADLTLSLRIREGGDLTDGNRHPLFPALLSPLARRSEDFFVDARLVSLVVAAGALAAVYAGASVVFGPALAFLASLAFLVELRFQARRVCPEPLAALLLFLAVVFLAHLPGTRRPRRTALAAGALLGAAWLTKGTVILSLVAALAWLLWTLGRRGLGRLMLVLLGFLLVASPLLAFNASRHGWPLYNANTDHVIWEDRWDADLDQTSTATMSGYLGSHDAGEILARLAHGLTHQKAVEWVYGFLVVVLVAFLVRRRARPGPDPSPEPPPGSPRHAWRGLAVVSCLVWLPPFAWYEPIVTSRRFLFPLVPVLVPPALGLLAGLVPGALRRRAAALADGAAARKALVGGGLVAALLAVVLVVRHGDPWRERHVDDASLAAVRRLSEERYRGAVVLAKPSRTIPPPWLLEGRATLAAIPFSVADAEAPAWIARRAGYVLLNPGLLSQRPGLFGALATTGPEAGIELAALPPWLAEEWRDPAFPCRYVLLRVVVLRGR